MSDGDEEDTERAADGSVEAFERRLESASGAIEEAETEIDLDDVEATLDEIEADLEAAEIPVPEPADEDEEPEDPKEDLEDELADLRSEVEDQRGPYDTDVVEAVEDVRDTILDTRWAEEGETELVPGVQEYLDETTEILDAEFGEAVPDPEELAVTLESVTEAVEDADLHPDEDAETIQDLLAATETLGDAVDAATAWTDLEIRERLDREGFYEPLEGAKHKDFPPEWSALKAWETRGNVEMVVLLLELMGDTDFITRHCIEALEYMGDDAGLDPLLDLANRRNLNAIDAIGKIGAEKGIEAIEGHAEGGRQVELQARSLRALGAIGSTETTELVAGQLVADSERVQNAAARALGMIGDPRAIAPLADCLEDTSVEPTVRASAAWALGEIGTERALEAAAEYATDDSYLVEQEATAAAEALGRDPTDEASEAAEDEESDEPEDEDNAEADDEEIGGTEVEGDESEAN